MTSHRARARSRHLRDVFLQRGCARSRWMWRAGADRQAIAHGAAPPRHWPARSCGPACFLARDIADAATDHRVDADVDHRCAWPDPIAADEFGTADRDALAGGAGELKENMSVRAANIRMRRLRLVRRGQKGWEGWA